MKIITSITEMKTRAHSLRREGKTIGFVPTMGFLHEGHLSLMDQARKESDIVVASIFVNPTQFGPGEDFDRYPRDEAGDQKKCNSAGVDILFLPPAEEMYPGKPSVFVCVEEISDVLEGAIRPGHYRGVATIVAKLFHIVQPSWAYFGQKDYQQCVVIKRMVQELHMDVKINIQPTIREESGLALSSRNSYLRTEERKTASIIYRAMSAAHALAKAGMRNSGELKDKVKAVLNEVSNISIDYVEIVHPDSLFPIVYAKKGSVLLAAVRIGKTRLIDNIVLP
ncbi:MAG: pantoate--beta-alanine ligase [Nitrospirota bacterium]